MGEIRFRAILPLAQCVAAAMFGGSGLWERHFILDQPVGDGTWWDSTARFHIWPWPYKFVAVTNFPAFLAGLLLGYPITERWPRLSEYAMFALSLPFIALLWFAVGQWFDRKWSWGGGPPNRKPLWTLLIFTSICAVGASVYIVSPVDYLLSGAVIWTTVGLAFSVSNLLRKFSSRAA